MGRPEGYKELCPPGLSRGARKVLIMSYWAALYFKRIEEQREYVGKIFHVDY